MSGGRPKAQAEIQRREVTPIELSSDGYLATEAGGLTERHAWLPETIEWWARIWETEAAQVWGPESHGLLQELARFTDLMFQGRMVNTAPMRRALEDRLLLTPKAWLASGFKVVDEQESPNDHPERAEVDDRRRRMRIAKQP